MNGVIIAGVAFWVGEGFQPRRLLIVAMVAVWGLLIRGQKQKARS